MERRMKRAGVIALVAAALFAGCTKDGLVRVERGSEIMFGASTEWLNGSLTRTEYSGKDENNRPMGGTSEYERIDWEPGYDRIRVLCEAAEKGPTSDYDLTGSTVVVAQKSQAKLQPTGGNGLRWGSESKDHYFYALFPASGMTSKLGKTVSGSDATIAVALDGESNPTRATVTGVIPASQSAVKEGYTYKPDMNHAYMYAVAKLNAGERRTVGLSFHPLVTAFEFTLLTPSGDPVTSNLTAVKLTSGSTDLTGKFTATLTSSGLTPLTSADITSAGREITVTLPDGGIALDDEHPVKVTMLALPVDQTELTLELQFANGGKRVLELKKNGNTEWVEVSACKKLYLQNVGVPGNLYYFDVVGPSTSLYGEASSTTYSVKSYRSATGENLGVGWTATFSTDGGASWSSTRPSWVTEFTNADANGSVTAKSYTAKASKNDATTAKTWKGSTTPVATDKTSAINLATRDIYGNENPGKLTTANCYVVSEPGWYKFPCVYGNGFENGEYNSSSYTSTNTRDHMLRQFVRHDNQPITDPWIQNNFTDLRYDTHAHVKVLWQDCDGLIATTGSNAPFSQRENTLSALGRYIYFYVDPAKIWQGNAVIALYLDDTIVWSWHIWVIEQESLATTLVYPKQSFVPCVVDPIEMMVTNLGWFDADVVTTPRSVKVKITQDVTGRTAVFDLVQDQLHGKGGNVYFQWGRKDPMLAFSEVFEPKDQYPSAAGWVIQLITTPVDLGTGIQHPNIFYAQTYGQWTSPRYDNLWNTSSDTAYDTDVVVVKTVYDPCPVGFKMPNRNVYSGFIKELTDPFPYAKGDYIGTWNQGYLYRRYPGDTEGIFFPATFLRERHTGEIDSWRRYGDPTRPEPNGYVGGYYWTASTRINGVTDSTLGGSYLEFRNTSSNVTIANSYGPCGYGFSVRPIKE